MLQFIPLSGVLHFSWNTVSYSNNFVASCLVWCGVNLMRDATSCMELRGDTLVGEFVGT